MIPESPSGEDGSQDVLRLDTEIEKDSENGEEEDEPAFLTFQSGDTTALTVPKDSIKHQIVVLGGGVPSARAV